MSATGLATEPTESELVKVGKWHVEIEESALDGSKTALLVLPPEADRKGSLGIRCAENVMEVIISIDEYMGQPGIYDPYL